MVAKFDHFVLVEDIFSEWISELHISRETHVNATIFHENNWAAADMMC